MLLNIRLKRFANGRRTLSFFNYGWRTCTIIRPVTFLTVALRRVPIDSIVTGPAVHRNSTHSQGIIRF